MDSFQTQKQQQIQIQSLPQQAACSVRVALRVRPLIGRELFESPNICVKCYPDSNQIIIGKEDRTFTFDKVFDIGTKQADVFEACVKNLVLGCFQGYNATVLAYGQTGSGKTHTMGSGYTIGLKEEELGIIPRVIKLIFDEVEQRKSKAEFLIKCTFLEIYNEEFHDLLDHGSAAGYTGMSNAQSSSSAVIDRFMQKKEVTIREEKNGNISVYGLREEKVNCYEELAACLDRGSNFRSTASTMMNNCSSRSHAIFTISIEQHIIEDLYKPDGQPNTAPSAQEGGTEEFMVAKFHFVDLAGSERIKRTGATGTTMKEGISINKGLLALGNVIAALTEEGKKMHVPYRDSKLTRILQDSLGGNSRTSMIACVSPAEINFEETLNTLKYASRARNIKNKPIVNRDPNSAQIAQLRQQVYELSRELVSCRKLLISNNIEFEQSAVISTEMLSGGGGGEAMKSSSSGEAQSRQYALSGQEIQRLEQEIKQLKIEKSQKEKQLQQSQVLVDSTKEQLQQSQLELFQIQKERDISRFQLEQITQILKKKNLFQEIYNEINGYSSSMEIDEANNGESSSTKKSMDENSNNFDFFFGNSGPCILEEYQVKVEEQKKELGEKNSLVKSLQKDYEMLFNQSQQDMQMLENKEKEIERLKRSVNKLQKENVTIKNEQRRGSKLNFGNTTQNNLAQINTTMNQGRQDTHHKKQQNSSFVTNPIRRKTVQAPFADSSNNQWLPNELDYNIKHFNELFIENLSQSLSTVLMAKKTTQQPSKADNEEEKEQMQSNQMNNSEQEGEGGNTQMRKEEEIVEDTSSSEEENEDQEIEQIIDEETKMQAQKEAIEGNEENKKQDLEMQKNLEVQEQQINHLEGDLKDKECLLEAIKESHKLLQNNLLEAMKMEYHKKIQRLDLELKQLEKEKSESLKKADTAKEKNKVEEGYKKKMKELEEKLKDLKKKDSEQTGMMKESTKQKQKIKSLEGEIEKVKQQKVGLMKKIKEESEKHRKWKNDRAMELIKVKQQNLKKDREIQKLKRDNQKKDQLAKRKQDELTALQKKSRLDKQKHLNADKQRKQKKNIDMVKIQQWIITNTDKMLKFKELKQMQQQEEEGFKEVEEQISEEQGQLAVLQVRKEKLEIKQSKLQSEQDENGGGNEDELYEMNEEIEQLEFEIKAINDNIESLEEKQDFIGQKISNITTELIGLSPDDIEQLNFEGVQSLEGARACLGAFFGILLEENVYKKQLENQSLINEANIDQLKQQVEELTNIQKANEINFQKQLEQINKEYKEKEELMMRIIMENGGIDMEQILSNSGEGGNNQLAKQTNDIFRQYLKNKENEFMEGTANEGRGQGGQLNTQQSMTRKNTVKEGQGNGTLKAAEQMKKSKEQQYNQSKTALSKRVAELERKNREEEKKFESMRHRFEQTNQEKELYKRQVDTFKQKLKLQEIQEVKNSKYNQDDSIMNSSSAQGSGTIPPNIKSPKTSDKQQFLYPNDKQGKLITLHEVRNQRKMKKMGGNTGGGGSISKSASTYEPKVIADEPMEDEEEGGVASIMQLESESPTLVDKQERKSTLLQGKKEVTHQFSEQINTSKSEVENQNVFARLSQGKKMQRLTIATVTPSNTSLNASAQISLNQEVQEQVNSANVMNSGFEDDHKWKCLLSKESAHNGQICALASVGNQLYSTSSKSLKIWDLDTMTCVSDISAHSGFIKCMTIWESKNLLLTASEKVIMLWDLISLTNVGVLKGHKDEIRAMNVTQDGNILFSGGKGNQNGSALLLWDLRKGAMPFDEKEKGQDIFSLASTKEHLFFGCRNHQVYPMNLKNYEVLYPFEPPHFDVVTSLAILENTLISGSRDKNLRCWDPYTNQQQNKQSDVMQAHQDWINALETDYERKDMYSGGKDGVVKVWKIKKRRLKCVAGLSSNSGGINCLSKIDRGFGKMFAQGSSDKSIRMWKFKDKYLNEDGNESNSPDYKGEEGLEDGEGEFFSQKQGVNNIKNNILSYGGGDDCESQGEFENNILAQLDRKEELKHQPASTSVIGNASGINTEVYKYQPVRQQTLQSSYSSVSSINPSQKLQQMRRQKRLQENQKRQQKENEGGGAYNRGSSQIE